MIDTISSAGKARISLHVDGMSWELIRWKCSAIWRVCRPWTVATVRRSRRSRAALRTCPTPKPSAAKNESAIAMSPVIAAADSVLMSFSSCSAYGPVGLNSTSHAPAVREHPPAPLGRPACPPTLLRSPCRRPAGGGRLSKRRGVASLPASGGQALHVPKHMVDEHAAFDQLLRAHRRPARERQRCRARQLLVAQPAHVSGRRRRALTQLSENVRLAGGAVLLGAALVHPVDVVPRVRWHRPALSSRGDVLHLERELPRHVLGHARDGPALGATLGAPLVVRNPLDGARELGDGLLAVGRCRH